MCFLWEKWCVSTIIVSHIKEEGQGTALLPYAVLLCNNLSSVLLGISWHSHFSGALVSPSIVAASTLEMEDLPICISSSLFAFFYLFFSHLCLLPRAEGSRPCISQGVAGSAGSRLVAPERTACFTLCTPCAAVCLLTDNLSLLVWSRDHRRWDQERRWCLSERFILTFFCSWSYSSPA